MFNEFNVVLQGGMILLCYERENSIENLLILMMGPGMAPKHLCGKLTG